MKTLAIEIPDPAYELLSTMIRHRRLSRTDYTTLALFSLLEADVDTFLYNKEDLQKAYAQKLRKAWLSWAGGRITKMGEMHLKD